MLVETPRPAFHPGTTIGQFRVVGELGAGGMGVVLEAHDSELDRHVAIKVVRDPNAGADASVRLAAEAQAMARLAHPNVVAVHEVGTIGDQVFLVMELVRGDTLAGWLERRQRPWRDIVAMFLQAGEGLFAAHRAGLIHRDFKPHNVLIDESERARVGDFGLARGELATRFAVGSENSGAAGTPAYMAPEQRFGDPVDARADQYAFAISLQQALSPKHALGKVSRRVRNAISRALAIDPDERYPSLDLLLLELRRGMRSHRPTIVAVGGIVVFAGLAVSLIAMQPADDDCADGVGLVDELWNPLARAVQLSRFLNARPDALISGTTTAKLVDEWADRWKLGRKTACSVQGKQRQVRLGCLDRGLHELRAQLTLWGGADASIVEHAVQAAVALPGPQQCAVQPTPALAEPVRAQIAGLSAMLHSGQARQAHGSIAGLLQRAEAANSPHSLAAALLLAGQVERELGAHTVARSHFSRAAREAGTAGDDQILFDALLAEASSIIDLGRPRDSLGLLDAADALQARARLDRSTEIALIRGDALGQAGRAQEAIDEIMRVLPQIEARGTRDLSARMELTRALGQLSAAQMQLDPNAAREALVRALALDEETFGPTHPEVAKTLHDLAQTELRIERYDDASSHLQRARAIFTAAYGPRHPNGGATLLALARVATGRGQLDEARALYLEARDALTGVVPDDSPYLMSLEQGLGEIARYQDNCKEALPHIERAIAMLEQSGHGENERAMQLTNLGYCLADTNRVAEARTALERSIAEIERLKMPVIWLAEPLGVLAELDAQAGHRASAIALARRALAALGDNTRSDAVAMRTYLQEQLAIWSR